MQIAELKVGDLARRTGLTVRTLHHYDEIGLLKPSMHTSSGHRLYSTDDVARIQQILSLRQLGFSLEQIGACLDRPGFDPLEIVKRHLIQSREQLEMQRQLCERLKALATLLEAAEAVSAEEFLKTIEVMTMMEKFYTPQQVNQFAEVSKLTGPEEIQAIEEAWMKLLAEVRVSQDSDPASAEAKALADRWDELTARTMRAYQTFPELKQAIAENYKQGKFEGQALAPQAADFSFINRVKATRQNGV